VSDNSKAGDKQGSAIPARLRRLYETIDSCLLEFGSLEPRQKAISALARELHVDKAQLKELVNLARANHPQINAVARVHKLIENAKASGEKPDLSMFRRLQPAAKSAGKDDLWLGEQLGYIPQFLQEAALSQKEPRETKSSAAAYIIGLLVIAAVGGVVWQTTYGGRQAEMEAVRALDDQAWQEASQLDSAEGYNRYLRNYPAGQHVVYANQNLSVLDEAAWEQASQTNTRAAYQTYLDEFDLHGSEARQLMEELLPGDVFNDCLGCPDVVVIPAGSYFMGSEEGNDNETPVHEVKIEKDFAVGVYEVTCGEWDKCALAQVCVQADDSGWGRGDLPVINVSWDDAQQFVEWLSQESGQHHPLPTEADWEYVARARSAAECCWGNNPALDTAACDG